MRCSDPAGEVGLGTYGTPSMMWIWVWLQIMNHPGHPEKLNHWSAKGGATVRYGHPYSDYINRKTKELRIEFPNHMIANHVKSATPLMPMAFLCYGNWVATTRFHGNAILGACHVGDWRHALHLLETFGSGETAVQRDVVSSWENDGVMPWATHSNMAMVYGPRFQDFSCFRYSTN